METLRGILEKAYQSKMESLAWGMAMKKTILIVAVALVAAGLVTSIAGFVVVSQANHNILYFSLGEDISHHQDERDRGILLEWAGTAILFAGLLLLLGMRLSLPKNAERMGK